MVMTLDNYLASFMILGGIALLLLLNDSIRTPEVPKHKLRRLVPLRGQLAIFLVLGMASFSVYVDRSEDRSGIGHPDPRCAAHMQTLHSALSTYSQHNPLSTATGGTRSLLDQMAACGLWDARRRRPPNCLYCTFWLKLGPEPHMCYRFCPPPTKLQADLVLFYCVHDHVKGGSRARFAIDGRGRMLILPADELRERLEKQGIHDADLISRPDPPLAVSAIFTPIFHLFLLCFLAGNACTMVTGIIWEQSVNLHRQEKKSR